MLQAKGSPLPIGSPERVAARVPPVRAELVVRREAFGPLMWSRSHHGYFLPRTDEDRRWTDMALDARRSSRTWDQSVPAMIAGELRSLGLEGTIREIASPVGDRLSAPLEVYFDYTWLCNLAKHKCGQDSYCYAAEFLGPTTMRDERVRAVIAELHEMGAMRLHLAGGEPTISKRALANYLDTASEYDMYTSMATNGLLIDDEVMEIIFRNNLKSVSFSVDGHDEQTHAAVRGAGLFDRTVDAIRRVIAYKHNTGSDMRVCIKPTYEPDTPDSQLEAIVRLGVDLRVDVVKFANPERCLRHDAGHYGQQLDAHYAKIAFIAELQEKYTGQVVITNVSNPMAGCGDIGLPGLEGCVGGQELLAINPDGSLTPCLMHQLKLGNISDEFSGLGDFWSNSTKLREFWTALRKPAGCADCGIHSQCRSGSTTRRVVQIGRFNADQTSGEFSGTYDPLCTRDFLARHPEVQLPQRRDDPGALRHFREIAVRHSL